MVFDFAAQPPELISAKIYSGPGTESSAGRRIGLGRAGQRVAVHRRQLPVGDLRAGQRRLDRSVVGSRGSGSGTVCVVAVDHGGAGRADRRSGPRRGQRLRDRVGGHRATGRDRREPHCSCCRCCRPTSWGRTTRRSRPLEAEYAQFWAQDVAAMTGYAGSSQAATTGLGSFTEAPQTTNDSGTGRSGGVDTRRRPRRRRLIWKRSSSRSRPT